MPGFPPAALYICGHNQRSNPEVTARRAADDADPRAAIVYGVAVDAALNVYYSETDHATVNKQSVVVVNDCRTWHARNLPLCPAGTDNGVSQEVERHNRTCDDRWLALNHPFGIAVDGSGNLYCIDYDCSTADGTTARWDPNVGQPYKNLLRKWTAATGQLVTIAEGGYYARGKSTVS